MSPSLTYRKRLQEKRERTCARMRRAKARKMAERTGSMDEVGRILFDGPMFGGEHEIKCMANGDPSHIWLMIDGVGYRRSTWKGVSRLLAKRLKRPNSAQG